MLWLAWVYTSMTLINTWYKNNVVYLRKLKLSAIEVNVDVVQGNYLVWLLVVYPPDGTISPLNTFLNPKVNRYTHVKRKKKDLVKYTLSPNETLPIGISVCETIYLFQNDSSTSICPLIALLPALMLVCIMWWQYLLATKLTIKITYKWKQTKKKSHTASMCYKHFYSAGGQERRPNLIHPWSPCRSSLYSTHDLET